MKKFLSWGMALGFAGLMVVFLAPDRGPCGGTQIDLHAHHIPAGPVFFAGE